MAPLKLAHNLWEATKPTTVPTDNKSVRRFIQRKAISPALWNACDYVLQFNFKISHLAVSVNTAADFLSRLELKVMEKIRLKIRENIRTTPIEVTTSSSDVAEEEQIFFTEAHDNDESEEQTLERKKQSQQNAMQNAMRSKWGTTLFQNKCERFYKNRRKHDVAFHEWNQGKHTKTSWARCRSGPKKHETENSKPITL